MTRRNKHDGVEIDPAGAKLYLAESAGKITDEAHRRGELPGPMCFMLGPDGSLCDLGDEPWDPERASGAIMEAIEQGPEAIITQGSVVLRPGWRGSYEPCSMPVCDGVVAEEGDFAEADATKQYGICFAVMTREITYTMVFPFKYEGGVYQLDGTAEDRLFDWRERASTPFPPRRTDVNWTTLSSLAETKGREVN